jgi:hypothetical protein
VTTPLIKRAMEMAEIIATVPHDIQDHVRAAVWWRFRGQCDVIVQNCHDDKRRSEAQAVADIIADNRDMTTLAIQKSATPEQMHDWLIRLGFKDASARHAAKQIELYNKMLAPNQYGAAKRKEELKYKRRVFGVFADFYIVRDHKHGARLGG